MEEWKLCASWLIECQVIPPNHRVTTYGAEAFTLAQTLRDGVLLCQLANRLLPNAVDLKEIALRPQMSQFLCLKNIRTFIQTCMDKFCMRRQDLFDPYQLFDVSDFGKVIATLSKLSHTSIAKSVARPFPPENRHQHAIDEDIYKTLEELADERDLADEDDDLYDVPYQDIEDDEIYGELCDIKQQLQIPKQSSGDQKRGYCIQEIVETEQNFVQALNMIIKFFIKPLKGHISQQDSDIIFANIEKLYEIHSGFLKELKRAVEVDNSRHLSKVFINWKDELLIYGDYCSKLLIAQDHIDEICKDPDVAMKIDECQRKANEGKFRLRDLLSVPMQRILKYHLLLRELERHTDKSHPDKNQLQYALTSMQDLSMYVNEVKRDNDTLQTITEIQKTLQDYKGPDLRMYGRLSRDGEVRLKSHDKGSDVKTRYIFLFDKVVLICKTRGPDSYVYKDTIELHKYGIEHNLPPGRGGKWKYCWNFTPNEPYSSALQFFTKTDELKKKWIEHIDMSKDNIEPKHDTSHKFEYSSFEKPVYCAVCSKLLCGVFYQGYKCRECELCAHKQCLSNSSICTPVHNSHNVPPIIPQRKPQEPVRTWHSSDGEQSLQRSTNRHSAPAIICGTIGRQGVPQSLGTWVATHNYSGIPDPPDRKVPLFFGPNDNIEVYEKSGQWWEGRNVRTSAIGFFPRTYIKQKGSYEPTVPSFPNTMPFSQGRHDLPVSPGSQQREPTKTSDLSSYPWYGGAMERETAEVKLEKLKPGSFIVRDSMRTGGYALSIKYDKLPKHIKIRGTTDKQYYLADSKMFQSIPELVSYYQNNSLSPSFPGVDTTLMYPYKRVQRSNTLITPSVIGHAVVLYDFAARDTKELTLKKGEKVEIMSKAGGFRGWWKGQIDDRVGYFPSTYVEEKD